MNSRKSKRAVHATEELYGLRNRAYTLLAKAIEEIRLCARYILSDNPQQLRGYASEYFRKSSRVGRQERKEEK